MEETAIAEVLQLFGSFTFYQLVCILLFNSQPAMLTLYILCLVSSGNYMAQIFNLVFHGESPYWSD